MKTKVIVLCLLALLVAPAQIANAQVPTCGDLYAQVAPPSGSVVNPAKGLQVLVSTNNWQTTGFRFTILGTGATSPPIIDVDESPFDSASHLSLHLTARAEEYNLSIFADGYDHDHRIVCRGPALSWSGWFKYTTYLPVIEK